MVSVLPDRLERFMQPDFRLRSGTGKGVNGYADVCLMQAVSWLANEGHFRDAPDCACPVITQYCVRLNDSRLFGDDHGHLLKPFAPRIVGTRSTPEIHKRRSLITCDYAVRVFVPIQLRALKREEWAAELESLAAITDQTSASAAKLATRRIREAAASSTDAYAASAAADAYAASAAADTYVAASASASAAEAAYTYAADAAWATVSAAALREKTLECLDAMLLIV